MKSNPRRTTRPDAGCMAQVGRGCPGDLHSLHAPASSCHRPGQSARKRCLISSHIKLSGPYACNESQPLARREREDRFDSRVVRRILLVFAIPNSDFSATHSDFNAAPSCATEAALSPSYLAYLIPRSVSLWLHSFLLLHRSLLVDFPTPRLHLSITTQRCDVEAGQGWRHDRGSIRGPD